MNSFLTGLYQISPVNQLAKGMKEFWKEYSEKREKNFAQQGYEDKGYGHCERIIANVGELLENYSEILYKLNKETFNGGTDQNKEEEFKKQFRNHLKPNLVLFITAAYIHDIGMCFPGIFKALTDVLIGSGDSAPHMSKIIHDHHNYATFIVLLEMNAFDISQLQNEIIDMKPQDIFKKIYKDKKDKKELQKIVQVLKNNEKFPYLKNIPIIFQDEDIFKLGILGICLTKIYTFNFSNDSNGGISISKEDFFIILAIICLHHQKFESHYVQSILRKFMPDRKEIVDNFNKWDAFFTRAREWTDLAPDWFPKEIKPDTIVTDKKESNQSIETNFKEKKYEYIGPELIFSKADTKLDLLLVEALLQYGDKTEITIARLMKSTEKDVKSMQHTEKGQKMTGLKKFWADTQWDNGKGYICTNMAQQVISSYARFRACRFIPLFLVKVIKNERTQPASLDVMMHYFRFSKDKDIFSFIRYHNEKDFQELKFLDVIKFHLPILLSFFNYKRKSIDKNPGLEINLKRKEFHFPTIDYELKRLLPHVFKENGSTWLKEKIECNQNISQHEKTQITSFLNKLEVRNNCQVKHIDSSLRKYEVRKKLTYFLKCLEVREIFQKIFDRFSSLGKTDYIVKSQEIKNKLDSMIKNSEFPYDELKKINDIINHEYNRDNAIYALYEELKFIFYCFPIINGNDEGIMKKIQEGIAFLREKLDDFGNKRPEELFPYTPQNREAIIEFSRSIKPKMDNKELFFKSSGLTIPPSFELMAILNLFQQEE